MAGETLERDVGDVGPGGGATFITPTRTGKFKANWTEMADGVSISANRIARCLVLSSLLLFEKRVEEKR